MKTGSLGNLLLPLQRGEWFLTLNAGGQHSEITDAAPQNVPLTALQRVINPERPEHIASDRRSGARGGLDPNVLDPSTSSRLTSLYHLLTALRLPYLRIEAFQAWSCKLLCSSYVQQDPI